MIAVYATDNNYVPWCGISILSLFDSNREMADLSVVVLDNGIAREGRQQLLGIAASYGRQLSFVDVRAFQKKMDFQADSGGFNQTTLVRLFLPTYLEDLTGTVLYLDCDTVVTGSLAELSDIDMTGYDLAAVPELYMPSDQKVKIGLSASDSYYNAGVLLINLDAWRAENLTEKFLSYYKKMNKILLYSDQDILNVCCRGRIRTLPQTYNLNPNLCYFPYWFIRRLHPDYVVEPKEAYEAMLKHSAVCHYMGDERPWIHGNHSSFQGAFLKYKAMSPWKDLPETYGQEGYMFCYHLLNQLTRLFPNGRILFSKLIGIHKYQVFGKK